MSAKASREMYLEVIYRLEHENGTARSIDIAKELNYSKPSISRAMGVLQKLGYVSHSLYGDVSLTKAGLKKAEKIYNKHKILTVFLTCTLGLDPEVAEQDACKIEHVISDQTVEAIENYLNAHSCS